MEGYRENSKGHLVPVEQIEEVDLLRDDFVCKAVESARSMSGEITQFKEQVTGDMSAFLDLSAEKFGVKLGGSKGNITLRSFDGKYMVTRKIAERIEFDERLQAAKILVDQCLREWTQDSPSEVQALIDDAFQVDKKGRINTMGVLRLRRLKIEHAKWQQAMDAIGEAITITDSCTYTSFYERDEHGKYQKIVLDFATL